MATMATVQELAKDTFKNHVVTQELDNGLFRSWRCAKPGTGMYSFRVLFWPGCVYIGGDLQDFVFERETDMLPWLKGAINDPHYMAGKVIAGVPREFDLEALELWIDRQVVEARNQGDDEHADELHDVLDYDPLTIESAYSSGLFDEIPRCEKFTAGYEWAIEALKWFVNQV